MTLRDIRLSVTLLIATIVLFLGPVLVGNTHFAGDILYSFHPWLTYGAQNLQGGHFPLWNPYSDCGQPFLANPQTLAFLPTAMVFWLFPFGLAWGWFLALHAGLLWFALYLALRRMAGASRAGASLGATAFAWSGFVVVMWEFPSAVACLPFCVLLLLFTHERRWALVPPTAALLFFSGYAPFFSYTVLLAAALVVSRALKRKSDVAWWTGALATGVLFALPQLATTWAAARTSLRAAITPAEARAFLITPYFLVKFLIPDIFDKTNLPFTDHLFAPDLWPIQRNWLNTFFVGTGAFLLGMAGAANWRSRNARWWAAAGIAGAALAMGVEPLFSVVRRGVPGFSYMTHFSNFMLIAVLALAFLVPEGVRLAERRPRALQAAAGFAALFAVLVAVLPAAREHLIGRLLGSAAMSDWQHASVSRAAWFAAGAAAVWAVSFAIRDRRARAAVWLALTLVELRLFAAGMQPVTGSDFFHRPAALAAAAQTDDKRLVVDPYTVANGRPMAGATLRDGYQSIRQALYPNVSLPFRVRSAWGYDVLPDRRFVEFRRTLSPESPMGPALRFVGGGLMLSTRFISNSLTVKMRAPHAVIYSNPDALPLVTHATKSIVFADQERRLNHLAHMWEPTREVVFESGASDTFPPSEPVSWQESPGRLLATGRGAGWLVKSEVDYPGWGAWLNGKRVPVLRANHAFQAVATPAGEWRIVMAYRPMLFRFSLLACLAALCAAGVKAVRRTIAACAELGAAAEGS